MRILVLGGTRFIGLTTVRLLTEQGHEVTIFHRGKSEPDLPEVEHIHGDKANLAEHREAFAAFEPDVALDMVPITEAGAIAVHDTLGGIVPRLVSISSQDIYRAYGRLTGTEPGPPDPVPLTEDSPLREKLYPYRGEELREEDDPRRVMDDYDKRLTEAVAMGDPDLPGTILRLPVVYGEHDYQHRLFEYLRRMDAGRQAIILEDRAAVWTDARAYVGNVAAAIALALTDDRSTGQIYNVAEPENLSEADWIRAIGKAAGWDGEIVTAPKDQLPESLRADFDTRQDMSVRAQAIREELGYQEPFGLEEALKRSVAWQRDNPPEAAALDYAAEDGFLASRSI